MIVFSEKTPERPPALGPAHLAPPPSTHCLLKCVLLDIPRDTKCNMKSDPGSFKVQIF